MASKKNKDLPFEEDVDLEFEYKVFMILDKLKKYKLFIIGGFIVLIAGIVVLFTVKEKEKEVLNQASKLAYQIKIAYESDNDQIAKKLISEFKSKYKDTPFMKLVLSYEIDMNKDKNPLETENISKQLKSLVETDQLKSGYNEYQAYISHEKGNDDEALRILGNIDRKYYNYVSAQLLTAYILKKQGNKEQANSIFEMISQERSYRYFSSIANENL